MKLSKKTWMIIAIVGVVILVYWLMTRQKSDSNKESGFNGDRRTRGGSGGSGNKELTVTYCDCTKKETCVGKCKGYSSALDTCIADKDCIRTTTLKAAQKYVPLAGAAKLSGGISEKLCKCYDSNNNLSQTIVSNCASCKPECFCRDILDIGGTKAVSYTRGNSIN